MAEELFPIVDLDGNVIGSESREVCHGGSFLLHPVVHLHIFNSAGELYLQKRSMSKDIQPGKWDTSVGGHVDYGETIEEALHREVREELNVVDFNPVKAFSYPFRSSREYEMVHSYYTVYDGDIQVDPIEISDGRYWTIDDIETALGKGIFTPNFESEFLKLKEAGIL